VIRRLRSEDVELLREAYEWDRGRPTWYMEMDHVFNRGSEDDLVALLDDPACAFIGIWTDNTQLTAVILIHHHGSGIVEGHLLARRGADTELLTVAVRHILRELFDCGLTQAFAWVAERNIGVRKLCVNMAMLPDGVVMWRGSYRGRVIKWIRHSVQREQLLMQQAA
jgi:hypothetical protein